MKKGLSLTLTMTIILIHSSPLVQFLQPKASLLLSLLLSYHGCRTFFSSAMTCGVLKGYVLGPYFIDSFRRKYQYIYE